MRSQFSKLPYFAVLLTLVIGITGCNIFDFTSDADKTEIEKAEEAIRDGNYVKAKEELADTVADSTDAHALYLDAKATLRESGVDIVKIVELIEGQDDTQEGENLGILDLIDDLSNEEQTNWYLANMQVSANLEKIFDEQTVGPFEPGDIALGYTVSTLMSGVLGLRDTNRDNVIDNNDFILNVEFIETAGASGYGFDGGTLQDGTVFNGLTVFLGDFASKGIAKQAGAEGYEPDDINELIAFVLSIIDDGTDALKLLLEKNLSSFEEEDIDRLIEEIAGVINFYCMTMVSITMKTAALTKKQSTVSTMTATDWLTRIQNIILEQIQLMFEILSISPYGKCGEIADRCHHTQRRSGKK